MKKNSGFRGLLGMAAAAGIAVLQSGWVSGESAAAGTSQDPVIDFSGFDRSIDPADDLFGFVNGRWIEETPIPSDKSRWGSFVILAEKSRDAILEIIDEVSDDMTLEDGSDGQKIRDLYRSYMDKERLEDLGVQPVQSELDAIDAIDSIEDLGTRWAAHSRIGVASPIDLWIGQDARDSTRYIVYVTQSGLGLPDRDFYFQDDERSVDIQARYRDYLATLFNLAGMDNAESRAEAIYEAEKKIAEAHWTRVANRDRIRTYNKKSREELPALFSKLDWDGWLGGNGVGSEKEFIIRQPDFLEAMDSIVSDVTLDTWKDYLRARVLSDAASYLSQDFFDASFEFYSKTLSGQQEPEPREKRAASLVNGVLGEVVGRMYVERHFPPQAKERMLELVRNLRIAMRKSLDDLDWMDDATRARALEKLEKFNTKIGYPDKWKDYSSLRIDPEDLLGNLRRASEFNHQKEVEKLGGPIDRDEWFMTPQTVNAYYNPMLNEIVFPAAILQPPFFNLEADDAVNYGAIGMVIGHEIGHGFDDQGRKSDGDGNLVDWWSEESATAYDAKAQQIVEQYNRFEPLEGFTVNGQLTLGENIGDLGGLTLAWRAFQESLGGSTPDPIDGFSAAQRFYLSFAQIWRVKSTTELTIRRLKTDTHSPPRFRVNGPLHNFTPFYEAFEVKAGDGMWIAPDQRVSIW